MSMLEKKVVATNRKPIMQIVKCQFNRPAEILASYLKKITGASFQIMEVSGVNPQFMFRIIDDIQLGDDGFIYRIHDKEVMIEGNTEQALVYAVYDFLERVIGVRYYTPEYEYIPFDANLKISFEEYQYIPKITYREILYFDYSSGDFAEKHKMTSRDKRDETWGFWCHSFETLCDPNIYFEEHPEYFALREGIRVKEGSQLCLSNPEVLNVVVKNLKKHIEKNPHAKYWSVSQNDNSAYCMCEDCKKLDDIDGGPIGSLLTFVNNVAKEFPDKIISTLAYWYSRKAPLKTRPTENVHIMLCNIEANRGTPIETDEKNSGSKQELLDWKEICNNVFLWDYCIQFKNLCSPFPNLRIIAPNIKFFAENNVTSLFSQANREIEGEFAALRGYLLAKLMWNPYADTNTIIEDFCYGYYKGAGEFILEYINLLHDGLDKTDGNLNIFGTPKDGAESYLSESLLDTYHDIFDKAEKVVELDVEVLQRVKTARLPIYYASIDLQYKESDKQLEYIKEFTETARKVGLKKVEEWKITTDQYVTDAIAAL